MMESYRDSHEVPQIGTKCDTCGRECEPEFIFPDHATCYACFTAIGALNVNAPEHLSDIPDWPMHVAKVMHNPNWGFCCGFCGTWRTWAEHGYTDRGVRHCVRCVDALDALRDGATDALAIFRGESS